VYLAVNAAYLLALGWDGARSFEKPLAAAVLGNELGDFAARGMSVLVMISALGAINGLIFTGSRVYSSLGRDWGLFAFLGRWNQKFGSPVWSILAQAVITISMIFAVGTTYGRDAIDASLVWTGEQLPGTGLTAIPWKFYRGGFETLVASTAAVFWVFFLGTGISLFALRQQDRDIPRPFSVPWFPLLPLIFCGTCFFMLYRALDYAGALSLLGWVPLAIGLPLYYLSKRTAEQAAPAQAPPASETAPAAPPFLQSTAPEPARPEPGTVDEIVVPEKKEDAPFRLENQSPTPEEPASQPPPT
jgi:amino acid transporter